MIGRPEEYRRMREVEDRHWWYRCLHERILDCLERHCSPAGTVVDVGCGTGGMLRILRQNGFQNTIGVDASDDAVAYCRAESLPVRQADLRYLTQVVEPGTADAVISADVLYFIARPDWPAASESLRGILKSGGILILNLPAFDAFRGIHDIAVGVRHRTTLRDLVSVFPPARFKVLEARYWPLLLSPAILTARWMQRWKLRLWRRPVIRSDIDLPPAALNLLLRRITGLEFRLPLGLGFGSSLFAVFRKI